MTASAIRDPAKTRADCLMLALRVVVGECAALPWPDEDVTLRRCPHALTAWRRLEANAHARARRPAPAGRGSS